MYVFADQQAADALRVADRRGVLAAVLEITTRVKELHTDGRRVAEENHVASAPA